MLHTQGQQVPGGSERGSLGWAAVSGPNPWSRKLLIWKIPETMSANPPPPPALGDT